MPWPPSRVVVGFFSDKVLRHVVRFGDLADALRAGQDQGRVVVWTDDKGVPHTRWGGPDPLPLPVSEEYRLCGYRVNGLRSKEHEKRLRESKFRAHEGTAAMRTTKPTPTKEITVTEPPTDDDADKIIDAERKAGRLLARLGLNRRAAHAHREHADLIASGAPQDQIDAAEELAKTLTDLALADLNVEA